MIELTQEEKQFLINLLLRLQVNPSDGSAMKTVELVQSLLKKLK